MQRLKSFYLGRLRMKTTGYSVMKLAHCWLGPAVIATAVLAATPARANFQVCNQTLDVVNVAVGIFDVNAWETSGWWTIGPNQCANVIQETLRSRYVYVYARDVFNGSMLNGTATMCVDPGEFRIRGRNDCLTRGHIAAQFKEIDTRRSERWTFFLVDPAE